MTQLGLETEIVDRSAYGNTVQRFKDARIRLPRLSELADPSRIPADLRAALPSIDPDTPHPLNLFRVHWHNAKDRKSLVDIPEHVVLPSELTGVRAPIFVVFGNRFPMIRAHKVLAAYGCLVPRLVTGQFDPGRHRAIWPSTGNYCRGGIAISRILDCRGVAVLPEHMSAERFRWLEEWATSPEDIIRTPGSESNVKEIYDKCAELARDPDNIVFNQFCEFGNHLVHLTCTGAALERVFLHAREKNPDLALFGFTSATGSAGTIAAGDHLKERFGTRIVAAEALECPTMLYNGFGEHNIQGIGDKHIPYIHNVTNTDFVSGVSDKSTDALNVLFNTDAGKSWLIEERGLSEKLVHGLADMGFSSICNVLAAIQLAKHRELGPKDALITIATDGHELYLSELEKTLQQNYPNGFEAKDAARVFRDHIENVTTEHFLELGETERNRIFNLGYFTWVEQQGVELTDFEARRSQDYWRGLRRLVPLWDERIDEFNRATGTA